MKYLWIVVLGLLAACGGVPAPTAETELFTAASVTLTPTSYRTTQGADGGQSVNNLKVKDQSGSQNSWTKYVEFQTPGKNYVGTRSYTLPAGVTPSALTGLQVEANFLGPTKAAQAWHWRLYNFSSNSWDVLGDNSGSSWSAWKLLSFNASGTLKNYVSSSREIRVRTDSSNASDDADLDYEAVTVSYGSAPPLPTNGLWWKPQKGLSWWWQLENAANLNTGLNVDVYDLDLVEGQDAGKIAALKSKGYKVICYFSAGTYEDFRPDKDELLKNNKLALIGGSSLPQFPNEVWLAIGDAQALETIIKPVMRARLDLAKSAGCDAVEPDNVDGYDNDETQKQISKAQQLSYNRWLAGEAHDRSLSVGLKNATALLGDLKDDFDFAVNEQCYAYSECSGYTSTFLAQNKPVFNQEYLDPDDAEGNVSKTTFQGAACTYFRGQQIASLWKSGLNLNGQGVVQCQP